MQILKKFIYKKLNNQLPPIGVLCSTLHSQTHHTLRSLHAGCPKIQKKNVLKYMYYEHDSTSAENHRTSSMKNLTGQALYGRLLKATNISAYEQTVIYQRQ